MKNPIDFFFSLGDKLTKGDPNKQQDFTYYMLWILFLAFASMFIINLVQFLNYKIPDDLVWAIVGFAITSLQYFNLKSMHEIKKLRKNNSNNSDDEVLESPDEMIRLFNKNKGGDDNVREKKNTSKKRRASN